MSKALQEQRRPRGKCVVAVAAADADLLRRVAAALATDDHRAQRLRWAIQNAGSSSITFEAWLASLGNIKQ